MRSYRLAGWRKLGSGDESPAYHRRVPTGRVVMRLGRAVVSRDGRGARLPRRPRGRPAMRGGLAMAGAVIGGGAALVGGLALANRALLLDDLPPTLPGSMHDWQWRGWRVRYTTMGAGRRWCWCTASTRRPRRSRCAASSSRSASITPSTPWTCSASASPSARRAVQRRALPRSALGLPGRGRRRAGRAGRIVAERGYAVAVARSQPGLVERLVLLSPTGTTTRARSGGRRAASGLPLIGTAAFNVLVSRASIQRYLTQGVRRPEPG